MPLDTILMLVTSHDKLGETGKKTGLHLQEFTEPYYALTDAGWNVHIVSPKGGNVPIDPESEPEAVESAPESVQRYLKDDQAKDALRRSSPVDQIQAERFAGLFIPGGHGTMWDFPDNPAVGRLVSDMNRLDLPIASVCHGPAALVDAEGKDGSPFVKNRQVNAFTDAEEKKVELETIVPFLLETRLRELGAIFKSVDSFSPTVVVDGNLMTGQNPASAKPLAAAFVKALRSLTKAA
ncbi:MAG: type 1 glutamine amidotransferase domain-containing protein [Alphaproteobacteria bacterium]|jgi:putative intracellular protease/amidase|nr:type 1 glutamine amidotransferase domain-containing protein [Alphaproteobacteria bacterium]